MVVYIYGYLASVIAVDITEIGGQSNGVRITSNGARMDQVWTMMSDTIIRLYVLFR